MNRDDKAREYIERVWARRRAKVTRRIAWAEFVMICIVVLLLFMQEVGA